MPPVYSGVSTIEEELLSCESYCLFRGLNTFVALSVGKREREMGRETVKERGKGRGEGERTSTL